jgi:hypothetical protein
MTDLGGRLMTRTAALRASVLFVVLTIIFGGLGIGSHALAAEAMSLISGALFVLMFMFWLAPIPEHRPLPVRIRGPRTYR